MKLYTTGCPQCIIAKKQLQKANIPYEPIEDLKEIFRVAAENDIESMPFLEYDGRVYKYHEIYTLIKSIEEGKTPA
jgi:glutaredoxin